MVRILETDTPEETARKIFEDMEMLQSVCISGACMYSGKPEAKSMIVMELLRKLDRGKNFETAGTLGKVRRKRVYIPNSIGAPMTQKTFRFKLGAKDGIPSVDIWRIQ